MTDRSIADPLMAARRNGNRLEPPIGLTESDALAILADIEARFGEPVNVYTVGATAPGAADKLGLSAPFVGPIFASAVTLADGVGSVDLVRAHGVQAEVEVVFRFGAAVDGGTDSAILEAVDAIAVGVEFPASRWTAPLSPPGPGFIADHAGNGALVVGPFVTDWRALDLATVEARLLVDGSVAGKNPGANVMGNPCNALVHCVRTLGRPVPAGTLVTSGGIIGPLDVPEGATVTGEIDGLTALTCTVTAH
ncbi:MAG: fumarylacetoacetate hydrolase family protein [Pseudomonadota bacterium]